MHLNSCVLIKYFIKRCL